MERLSNDGLRAPGDFLPVGFRRVQGGAVGKM